MFIYKVINLINDKCYIGQTQNTVEERWKEHIYDSQFKDFKFYRAIRKYGSENFKVEVLEEVSTTQELNEREKFWIQYYDSYKNGYNSTLGGEDNPMNYQENRDKVGKSKIGNKNWLGKVHTEETKQKMSEIAKGRKMLDVSKNKLSQTRKEKGLGAKGGFEHPTSRSVAQIDIYTNEVIKIFGSIREAEITLNGKETGLIQRVINPRYRNKTAFGYKWEIVTE
jgi:group I intron endonuclease